MKATYQLRVKAVDLQLQQAEAEATTGLPLRALSGCLLLPLLRLRRLFIRLLGPLRQLLHRPQGEELPLPLRLSFPPLLLLPLLLPRLPQLLRLLLLLRRHPEGMVKRPLLPASALLPPLLQLELRHQALLLLLQQLL